MKLPSALASLLASSRPARFAALNLRLQKEAERKKLSPDIAKLAADYWDALAFRTMVTLAGQVYAANLRADDLLVSEDALFLRKHQFVVVTAGRPDYFAGGSLHVSSEGAGSRAEGGFDGIAVIAGELVRAACATWMGIRKRSPRRCWAVSGRLTGPGFRRGRSAPSRYRFTRRRTGLC